MTALSFATLANGSPFAPQPTAPITARSSVDAFQDAMSRQVSMPDPTTRAQNPVQVASSVQPPSATAPDAVKAIRADNGLDASTVDRERVRKSLGLPGVAPTTTTGDTILGGIQSLRKVFDARTTHMADLMKSDMANTQSLLAMQVEVAQYSVMVDVSSKLMGKASSSLDTLMKGQ